MTSDFFDDCLFCPKMNKMCSKTADVKAQELPEIDLKLTSWLQVTSKVNPSD